MAIDINIPSQVKNYANLAAFPATGTLKTIFIAEDTNKTYRWTGSIYVEISASQAAAWGTITGTLSTQTDLQNALNAKVTGNTAITGATKTKLTYDSKGLVTSGADATTADIADSLNKRYVTDANLTTIGNQSGVNTGDQTLAGLGGVPTTRTLTINGTTQDLSADRTFTVSTGITIGTTAITSGVVGRVMFQGTGNVVQQAAGLFYDAPNGRFGVGTANPNSALEVVDTGGASFVAAARFLVPNNNVAGRVSQFYLGQAMTTLNSIAWSFHYQGNGSTANYQSFGFNGIATPALTMFGTLNVGINTTTDAGFKLDVNGTARFIGDFNIGGASQSGFGVRISTTVYLSNGLRVDGSTTNNGSFTVSGTTILVGGNTIVRDGNKLLVGGVSGDSTPAASAVSEIRSTTQGFLPPRMTTTQKNAIATPATGLMVYDTTLNLISVYNGTIWISL